MFWSKTFIENDLGEEIALSNKVSPELSQDYWRTYSQAVAGSATAAVLGISREEGITDGHTWVFTTSFTLDGVAVQLQQRLTGTFTSSDLQVQIAAGGASTGWKSTDTSLTFQGATQRLRIDAHWISNSTDFDDLRFTAQPAAILPQIQHVVVLMMENRSLDNLLGWIYAPDNQPPNNIPPPPPGHPTSYDGLVANRYSNSAPPAQVEIYASEGTTPWGDVPATMVPRPDPGESFDQMTEQIFNGQATADMGGFLADYQKLAPGTAGQIMQSYSPDQVPVITKLATSFAVSDAWFASCPCQTWPNRGFLHTGSSDGHINNDHYEPYDIETIFNLLYAQGVTCAVYNDTDIAPSLVHTMFPKLWDFEEMFQSMAPFYSACKAPKGASASEKLPRYSFIEPDFTSPDQSYHPPHDIRPAEAFLQTVYAAIQGCEYRDEILFVITFDEHGGCYDHVPPPGGAVAPKPGSVSGDGRFHFDRFGVRVPAIVVSSYVAPGTVFRSDTGTPYDHTSILATLRDWVPIGAQTFEQTLPSPRIAQAPTLEPVLTLDQPRSWPDIPAVPPTALLEGGDTPLDALQQGVVVGEANLRAGRYVGADEVRRLLRRVRTREEAESFFAEAPPRKPRPDSPEGPSPPSRAGCRGLLLRMLGEVFSRRPAS